MDNPEKEIAGVLSLVTSGIKPEMQKESIQRYYTKDVPYRHPFFAVLRSANSRPTLVGLFQWFRIVLPKYRVDVERVTYDEDKNELFLDSRVLVHMKLRAETSPDGDPDKVLHYIAEQEDFLRPDDVIALFAPPLVPLALLVLHFATFMCVLGTFFVNLAQPWVVRASDGLEDTSRHIAEEGRRVIEEGRHPVHNSRRLLNGLAQQVERTWDQAAEKEKNVHVDGSGGRRSENKPPSGVAGDPGGTAYAEAAREAMGEMQEKGVNAI
ncbi:hypothetical protein BD309DRAFT_973315 [Dichomitus squalens]|nr:hypothetical protein BD309DRAFT_973315 [Dichomitus squalens]